MPRPFDPVEQVAWVHDELQFDHQPGLGGLLGEISRDCIRRAGERLGFRGVLRSDSKTGPNWAACH